MRVLVTGASGFVGRHLVTALRASGHEVRTAGFSSQSPLDFRIPLAPDADWAPAVANCDALVHAGALAHVFGPVSPEQANTFADINTRGTLALARAAAEAGVARFVFISSVAASGPGNGTSIRETDPPQPISAYGRSKLEAEQALASVAADTGLEIVSLRPPLVYGPDAGGRFRQVLIWCNRGLPLPFGAIHNRRSYLSIDNLANAVLACLTHPGAAGQVFNIADDEPLSTPDLVRLVCAGLGKPCRLFAVPTPLLRAARKLGVADAIDRLSETMLIDTTAIRSTLDWQPSISARDGIRAAASAFKQQQ
jgi:nucleoside-diphosphate-sugar epimerase